MKDTWLPENSLALELISIYACPIISNDVAGGATQSTRARDTCCAGTTAPTLNVDDELGNAGLNRQKRPSETSNMPEPNTAMRVPPSDGPMVGEIEDTIIVGTYTNVRVPAK